MNFNVITLFPEIIESYCSQSILGRARKQDLISLNTVNPRDFVQGSYKKVDDTPYGGGAGMVLMCEPFFDAYESIEKAQNSKTILLTPQGKPYNQEIAKEFSLCEQLVLICGHYEGFDERIRQGIDLVEVSIGDFVLTGGELASLCIIDSVSRFLPDVLGKDESAQKDSFSDGLLEHPHYTRPCDFRGMKVPDVLLSGNHQEIAKWRRRQSIERTIKNRPDLFERFLQKGVSKEDKKIINEYFKKEKSN